MVSRKATLKDFFTRQTNYFRSLNPVTELTDQDKKLRSAVRNIARTTCAGDAVAQIVAAITGKDAGVYLDDPKTVTVYAGMAVVENKDGGRMFVKVDDGNFNYLTDPDDDGKLHLKVTKLGAFTQEQYRAAKTEEINAFVDLLNAKQTMILVAKLAIPTLIEVGDGEDAGAVEGEPIQG